MFFVGFSEAESRVALRESKGDLEMAVLNIELKRFDLLDDEEKKTFLNDERQCIW